MVDKFQAIYNKIITEGYKNNELYYIFELIDNSNLRTHTCKVHDLFYEIFPIEKKAFSVLKKDSRILDIGAGAGRICYYLQNNGYNVTALEKSSVIADILKKRKIKKIVTANIFDFYPQKKFDIVIFFRVYSIFGTDKNKIKKILKHLDDNVLERGGKICMSFFEPEKGKSSIIKRRFIFGSLVSPWLRSIRPSLEDIIEISNETRLKVSRKHIDQKNYYYVILEKKDAN